MIPDFSGSGSPTYLLHEPPISTCTSSHSYPLTFLQPPPPNPQVQPWNDGTWNYISRLRNFVLAGMPASDTSFIDGVSGIVNRGCAALSCPAGAVDGVDGRRANFRTVLSAMKLV